MIVIVLVHPNVTVSRIGRTRVETNRHFYTPALGSELQM